MKHINEMTRKEFLEVPKRVDWKEEVDCDSVVMIPGLAKDKHDSGYRCMTFVACSKGNPVCIVSSYSDVICLDGIGGYGYRWIDEYDKNIPESIPPSGWQIDCLPKSGLFQIWPSKGKIKIGSELSTLEIYSIRREKK